MTTKILPDSFLRRIAPADRKAIGQQTAQEASDKFDRNLEAKLQKLIRSELLRRNIPHSYSPMRTKTTVTKSWPDFTFPLYMTGGRFGFIEAKSPGAMPSPAQIKMHEALVDNGALGIVADNFLDVKKFLDRFAALIL